MRNLKKISADEYVTILKREPAYNPTLFQLEVAGRKKNGLDLSNVSEMFLLRGTSFADGSPYIALREPYPKTQRVVDTMARHGGKLVTETGFECRLLAFKAAGPFELILVGRRVFAADEAGCYAVDIDHAKNQPPFDHGELVSRNDTFELRTPGKMVGSVEVEFAASAIVNADEVLLSPTVQ